MSSRKTDSCEDKKERYRKNFWKVSKIKKIIVVVGPTASGKSDLGIFLSQKLDGEIICADSIQIYKNLDIISAKPSKDDINKVRHHLIDFLDINQDFSVADFKKIAEYTIKEMENRNILPIIVGGTGLYIDSLVNNIEFSEMSVDNKLRNYYENISKTYCNRYLYELLKSKDEEMAKKVHPNNIIRIIRSLEIIDLYKINISDYKKNALKQVKYNSLLIGLNYRDRQGLYNKINNRVDIMLHNGLINDAYKLYNMKNVSRNLDMAIGYKELKGYFEKKQSLDECIEDIKKYSRRYAKRQITWFKRNHNINWFYIDDYNSINSMYNKILERCNRFLKEGE